MRNIRRCDPAEARLVWQRREIHPEMLDLFSRGDQAIER